MRESGNIYSYSEAQNVVLSLWLQLIEETYRLFGFSRLLPCSQEVFSQNEALNIMLDLAHFNYEHATILGVPTDRTQSLAYWVAKNFNTITFPYKRYGVSHSYRPEGSQGSRFLGALQADIDVIGYKTLDSSVDAECIFAIYEALRRLGIGDLIIYLNHIRLVEAILKTVGGLTDEQLRLAFPIIHSMPKLGVEATMAALLVVLGMDARRAKVVVGLFSYKGTLDEFLKDCPVNDSEVKAVMSELDAVFTTLINLGVPKEMLLFWPGNVQGFNHYSRVVYRLVVPENESETIAAGGRYDNLVSTSSHMQLPGVGGSIDITRLFAIASQRGWIDLSKRSESQVFVGFRSPDLKILAQYLAFELRRTGLRVDLYSGEGNVKKQFAYADRKGIPVLVMIMDGRAYVVRNLLQGKQTEVPTIEDAAGEAARLVNEINWKNETENKESRPS